MAGKKSSKNNPGQRRGNEKKRMFDGKPVKAVMYGRKRLMAAEVEGQLICDEDGNPPPYRSVGVLV